MVDTIATIITLIGAILTILDAIDRLRKLIYWIKKKLGQQLQRGRTNID